MNAKNPDLAPETHNSQQDDEAAQAQQVAEEAGNPDDPSPLDSEKVGSGVEGADEQDLIDHMRDMEGSGRIDMGAFAGEPNMDDENDTYGAGHDPDKV